jgi:type I restriction enzyme M protein
VDGEVAVITRAQAAEADYNLSPSRWAGNVNQQDQRPITEIIADLFKLDDAARDIDTQLGKLLASLGEQK